jgi:hypothetical protein
MSRHRCIICHKELTQEETITTNGNNYCHVHVGLPITKRVVVEEDDWEWSS